MRAARSATLLVVAAVLFGCAVTVPAIEGIVWQPDNETTQPRGDWERLGVKRLLVQWTVVDGVAFVEGTGLKPAARLPDWRGLAREPWAREVVLGLAGHFEETRAREQIAPLVQQSARLAQLAPPVKVAGWYFPVEIDPTWAEARRLGPLLAQLPRPLWISVYDSANVGPEELAQQLASWLPADVGVFFQDGVGVHAREAYVAKRYLEVLARRLGRQRVQVIAEAFRPKPGGGFRAATADEMRPQLAQYAGYPIWLFESRYVSPELVRELAKGQAAR
jgi:hypothetical protein